MAGKQKYGRGISLGLLEIDSCSLARELKSDPDTTIGDEIKRIILTKNESYALVACTEYSSTFTCFVVFKLETIITTTDMNEDPSSLITGSMSNCTMILTRFNCDPNYTFSIVDSNNNGDQYMLTILRTNEIIIWQLNDGEILFNYDFNYLFNETNTHEIHDCQMNDNRLLIFAEQGSIYIWDITIPIGQFLLIANISDPLVSLTNSGIDEIDSNRTSIVLFTTQRKYLRGSRHYRRYSYEPRHAEHAFRTHPFEALIRKPP
jgi:hypothetical protein